MGNDQKSREEFENNFKKLLRAYYSGDVFYYKSPLISVTGKEEIVEQPKSYPKPKEDEEIVF